MICPYCEKSLLVTSSTAILVEGNIIIVGCSKCKKALGVVKAD